MAINQERFEKSDTQRIILREDEIVRLVRGGVIRTVVESRGLFGITRRRIAIAMSDIGFDRLHAVIEEAEGLR